MGVCLEDESCVFEKKESRVKDVWKEYIKNGGTIAKPENYITVN